MEKSRVDVVIGMGPLGLAVTRLLSSKGEPVRAIHRTGKAQVPPGVEVLPGDIGDLRFARDACRSAATIYLCAKPPYQRMADAFQPIMDGAIAGAVASQAKLVYADSLYAYGPVSGELREDLPYAATGRKGKARARLAAQLMAAHAEGRVRATIGRASDFYGPGVIQSAVGERVFGFALAGKAASVTGDPGSRHTYTFVDDFARGLLTLGERDEALGQTWHVPSAETITTHRFVELIFEELGRPPRIQVAPRWMLSLVGMFDPVVRELPEIMYQTEQPFVVDHSKFERAFGARPTPHREAIRATLDWYRQYAPKAGS
jgi:nucleoside-diphosphate-sugar epimerase